MATEEAASLPRGKFFRRMSVCARPCNGKIKVREISTPGARSAAPVPPAEPVQ
jgi:hypothetical protein